MVRVGRDLKDHLVPIPLPSLEKNSVPTAGTFSRKTCRVNSPTEITESILGRPGIL